MDIDDNTFATGVDDISITSNDPNLRGYQDEFWIMAPCGGQEYNGMRFKIPLDPAANLKIETTNATPDPMNSSLGTTTPGPVVTWEGIGSSSLDHTPVWKLGEAEEPVELPIRVKNMKYRTVTVAVYPVRDPQSSRAVVPLPAESVLQAKMDETFGVQLNAWISLDYRPQQNYDYDPDGDGYAIILESPHLQQMYEQASFNVTNADIRVFVIDNVYLRDRQANVPGTLNVEVYGTARPPLSAVIVNAGNPIEGVYTSQNVVDTIAHEIGHLMVGEGHPNDYNIELRFGGNHAEPAPLPGTDTSVRLMCGRDSRVAGARFLVKAEWDIAEGWLSARPGGGQLMKTLLLFCTFSIAYAFGSTFEWDEKSRQKEADQVALWESKLIEAQGKLPDARLGELWLGLRNMGHRRSFEGHSPTVDDAYLRIQQELLSIPGHAKYFADELERLRLDPKSNYDRIRPTYLAETLRHLPSPETIQVLGDLLSDMRDTPIDENPKYNEAVRSGEIKPIDWIPTPQNAWLATCALSNIGLQDPPFEPVMDYDFIRFGTAKESLPKFRAWWEEIKSGKRTFSFKGQKTEYRFKPDGTWETIAVGNLPTDNPKEEGQAEQPSDSGESKADDVSKVEKEAEQRREPKRARAVETPARAEWKADVGWVWAVLGLVVAVLGWVWMKRRAAC